MQSEIQSRFKKFPHNEHTKHARSCPQVIVSRVTKLHSRARLPSSHKVVHHSNCAVGSVRNTLRLCTHLLKQQNRTRAIDSSSYVRNCLCQTLLATDSAKWPQQLSPTAQKTAAWLPQLQLEVPPAWLKIACLVLNTVSNHGMSSHAWCVTPACHCTWWISNSTAEALPHID